MIEKRQVSSAELRVEQLNILRTLAIQTVETSPENALQLMESVLREEKNFNGADIKTLASILVRNPVLGERIAGLVSPYLEKATAVESMKSLLKYIGSAKRVPLYKRNNKQILDALNEIAGMLKVRLLELDPAWEEGAETKDKKISRERHGLYAKSVEEIEDTKTCLLLSASSNIQQNKKYLDRYVELKGDERNAKYVRLRLHNVLYNPEEKRDPTEFMKTLLEAVGLQSFKKWVKKNNEGSKDFVAPNYVGRMVLRAYRELCAETLTEEDWIYFAERSVVLGDVDLQKRAFKYLAELGEGRSSKAQRAFDMVNGVIHTEESDKKRGRSSRGMSSSVFENGKLASLTPVNSVARKVADTDK